MSARSTSGRCASSIEASNCMMIGAATPTVWPSESWNWPLTCVAGSMVANVAAIGTALPSRPTTEPAQVYTPP
jgi:hypothetical protein